MVRVFYIAKGFAKNYLAEIKKGFQKQLQVTEAKDEQDCDVIVALCTIVSRVGTDIKEALQEIPSTRKPALLVVFHHTFDSDYVVPNTQRFVNTPMITADFLFNEEDGLRFCSRNEDSMRKAVDFLSQYETLRPATTNPTVYSTHATVCRHNICVLVLFSLLVIILLVLMGLKLAE